MSNPSPLAFGGTAGRFLPLVGVLVFVGIGVGLRSVLHRRWYGGSGIAVIGGGGSQPTLVERSALLLPIVLLVEALLACTPAGDAALATLAPAGWRPALGLIGFAAMLVGTAAMFVAQLEMGASWRIGIDRQTNPGLVTDGLYRFSRNPIYLCMFVVLAGFVLLLPGWPALAILIGTFAGIRIAVVGEEAHLAAVYGDEYRAYAARVGRFVPGLGRLGRPGGSSAASPHPA